MSEPAGVGGRVHDGSGRIHVQGLSKSFGPVDAVRDLSFSVYPGAVTGFIGPNGSGKSTALRMILGLVKPTAGTATINGVPFHRLPNPGKVIGAVLDAQSFHPGRTARNHLRCYAAAMEIPDAQPDRALDLVGLGAVANRRTGTFSLGMRQRLALASALLGDPQLLVLDEPTNGLDPDGIVWLRNFLRAFAARGRTVLIASHFLRELEYTADQIVIISRGRCVFAGHLDQLRAAQGTRAFVHAANPEKLSEVLQEAGFGTEYLHDGRLMVSGADAQTVADLALDAEVVLHGIQDERTGLEQLFFQLTHGQYPSVPQTPPNAPYWTGEPGPAGPDVTDQLGRTS